jgi:hypothetical protein
MAWSLVGATSAEITAGAGSQSITLPGTPAENDLVLVQVGGDVDCSGSVTTSGYTAIQNSVNANPGRHVAYKVLGATPDSTVAVSRDAAIKKVAIVQVWRGVDTADVVDAAYSEATAGNSATHDPPSITAAANALVFALVFLDDDDTTVSTWPSGYTNQIEDNAQGGANASCTIAMSSKESTGGTEDPSAYVMGTSDAGAAATFSFNLAAVDTPKAGSDSATLTEGEALEEAYTDSDSATLTDTGVLTTSDLISDSDPYTYKEAQTVLEIETTGGELTLTDTGSNLASVPQTGSDSATLTDTASNLASEPKSDSDSATLTDAGTVTEAHVYTGADSASLTDTAAQTEAHTYTGTDSVALTDTGVLTEAYVDSDSATLTDTGSNRYGCTN